MPPLGFWRQLIRIALKTQTVRPTIVDISDFYDIILIRLKRTNLLNAKHIKDRWNNRGILPLTHKNFRSIIFLL